MARLTIPHPEKGPQKTYLTAETAAAATASTVQNNDDFAEDDLVLFGDYGQEKSEIVTLTGVTGSTQLDHTAGPSFAHAPNTPIYQLAYDQVEIYSATAEGGSYSLVTTANLNVDETYTIYNHSTGGSTTWYKIRYKNSVSAATSDYSDETQATGFKENSLGSMTDEVLASFGDADSGHVSRDQVKNYLNSGVRRMVMRIIQAYPDYFGAYDTQALTASTTYSYPTRFIAFQRAQIGSSLSNSYKVEFKSETDLDPSWTYLETDPKIVLRDATWKTYPDCASKTAYLYYWQYPATMDDDNDLHGLPYGGRDVLVAYALYKIWLNRDVDRATLVRRLLRELEETYMEFIAVARQGSDNQFQRITHGRGLYDWGWDL